MIGRVETNHALLRVPLLLSGQPAIQIEFVIDTGFVGYLTLPAAAVSALNLPFLRRVTANLADDSTIHVSIHTATIEWQGEEREVEVLVTGRQPLLGTLMLDGNSLSVQFKERGSVAIDSLQ